MNINKIDFFGSDAFIQTALAGEKGKDVAIDATGLIQNLHYFYVQGRAVVHVKETGEPLADRLAGWLNTEHKDAKASTGGTLSVIYPEDTEWIFIPGNFKLNGVSPTITSLVLEADASTIIPANTNLYLVKGNVTIDGIPHVGPCQILASVLANDAAMVSVDKSYSLKVA